MVDNGILPPMNDPWVILGQPASGGILVVCDHASNHVPDEIELGIDRIPLSHHIAYDIGVTGVAETPFAATEAEVVLVGSAPSEEAFRAAGAAAAAQSRPSADVRGPVDYKRAMVAELTLRSLRTAVGRALAWTGGSAS